jgi:hypothetical protein
MNRMAGITILATGIGLYILSMLLRVSPDDNLYGWQCFILAFRELPDALMKSGDWSSKALYLLSDYSNAATLLCAMPFGKAFQKVLSMTLMVSAPAAVLWLYFGPDMNADFSVAPILWGFSMMLVAIGVYAYAHHDA